MMLPLLRAPPFHGAQVTVSTLLKSWAETEISDAVEHELAAAIIQARVGGRFWAPCEAAEPTKPPNNPVTVAVLPENAARARFLWQHVLLRAEAANLLVVFPHLKGAFAALANEVIKAGAGILEQPGPHEVLDRARDIYLAAMADIGVLGLLAGRPVYLYGPDGMAPQSQGRAINWLTAGTIYTNPFSGKPAGCAETVELLADWRRMLNRNRTITACAGITFWKRRRVAQLLARDLAPPRFCRSADAALAAARAQGGAVAIWSSKSSPDAESKAAQAGIKLRRMEDGFIRSRGLGSDFLAPASIVLDSKANYFDPSRSSDLEDLLANTVFDAPLRARARRLINLLVQGGVSKYAVSATPPLLSAKPGQRIVLVPGQVADDLSVRLGGGSVRGNADLLARVRAANPDAFIIFRPHPDVEAGHRPGAIANPVAAGLADQVSREHGIAPLLSVVDEVHTLTSLAGFEAVLRGRRVETYGQPFYAGWGLTVDHAPLARRQRRLTIEELAAAALILYPHYIDPGTGLLCGPETLIASFANQTLWRPGKLMQMRRWQGRLRYLLSMIIVRSAPARDSSPRPREDQIRS